MEHSGCVSWTLKAASTATWVLPIPPRPSMAVLWQLSLFALGGILARSRRSIDPGSTKHSFRPKGTVK